MTRVPALRSSGPGLASAWILAAVLPLAASPTPTDPGFPLRLLILGVGLGVGLLGAASGRLPQPVTWTLAAGLAAFTLAALAGATPVLSLLGRFPRYEGLPVVAGYAAALWVGARAFGAGAPRNRDALLHALAAAAVVHALVAVVQVLASPGARVSGLLGNATTLGTFGLIALGMLGWQLADRRDPVLVAGFASAVVIVALSASRGVLLGGLVASVLSLVWWSRTRPRPRWWLLPTSGVVLATAMLAIPMGRSRLSAASPFAEATVSGRALLWSDTFSLVREHPWLGVGPSRFVDSIGVHHGDAWAAAVGPYAPPDSPHLVLLQVVAASGVVGLVALLGLGVTVLLHVARQPRWDAWQAGAFTTATAVGVTYLTSFTDPVTTTLVALVVGGAVSAPLGIVGPTSRRGRDVPARVSAALAVGLGVLLGGSALLAEGRYNRGLEAVDAQVLTSATGVRPWDADLARRVGYTLNRLAEQGLVSPESGVGLVQNACRSLPGSVECLQTLGDALDLSGRPDEALSAFDQALSCELVNVDTHLRRGVALARLGRLAEAEEAFRRAAALRPTAPEPWDNLATLFEMQGRTVDAAQASATADDLRHR